MLTVLAVLAVIPPVTLSDPIMGRDALSWPVMNAVPVMPFFSLYTQPQVRQPRNRIGWRDFADT